MKKISSLFLAVVAGMLFLDCDLKASEIDATHQEYEHIIQALKRHIENKYEGTHSADAHFKIKLSGKNATVYFVLVLPPIAKTPSSPMKTKLTKKNGLWEVVRIKSNQPWYIKIFGLH
jgi:hypothetical protein